MQHQVPRVSILMGVYNCAQTIQESIASVVSQTFTDWELIVCDDGSTDNTLALVESLARDDERIRVFYHSENAGLARALNTAASHARGEYFARQDGDDISRPERFERQVSFLDSHPGIAVVGSAISTFDGDGTWGFISASSEWPTRRDFVTKTPFLHATVMMRREAFLAVGGYRSTRHTLRVEDYDLWSRLYGQGFRGHNMDEVLYEARDDRATFARRKYRYRVNEAAVRIESCRRLGAPAHHYVGALRPLAVGLVPPAMYRRLRRRRHSPAVLDEVGSRTPPS